MTHPTIFWPLDVNHSGFCYGWIKPAICVAGVLHADSASHAETLLQQAVDSQQWLSYRKPCGENPLVLGRCSIVQDSYGRYAPPQPILQFPSLQINASYSLIYYHRHGLNTMRFYSLDFLPLEGSVEHLDPQKAAAYEASLRLDFSRTSLSSGLDAVVINQFNSSKMLEHAIHINDTNQRSRPSTWHLSAVSFSQKAVTYPAGIWHIGSGFFSTAYNTTAPLFPTLGLKDILATIQQMDVRAEQVEFLIHQYHTLRGRPTLPVPEYSAQYVNSYNTLWLILNDIIVGTAFGQFLCENHIVLSSMLCDGVENVLIDWPQWSLRWLDSWPAGLKLNTELSRFYSHTFIYLVASWGSILRKGVPYLPSFIYFVGIMSTFGITTTISLLSDLLTFLTAHISICYLTARVVYRHQLKMASSLWNLFRGKRYNPLRNRIDPWVYDMDQLLFGTMLFTLLAFLFPTVLAYYSLFAILRLCTILLHAAMETLLAFMNHFPLFALTLRVKDPWRLPGGIYFAKSTASHVNDPVLVVKSKSVPLAFIFSQYIGLWSRLSSHYNPVRLLHCLFSGVPIAAISKYSIRYHKVSMNKNKET